MSKSIIYSTIILAIISTFSLSYTSAQTFEIRAVNKDSGVIGIEMRVIAGVAPKVTDYITDIVFGIKWNQGYGVDLLNAISTAYNIKKSGTRVSKNGFHFQAFYSDPIGFNPTTAWQTNNWVEIMSISNNKSGSGKGLFQVVEKGFDITTDPNIGLNFLDYSPLINGVADQVILPINFLTFDATAANNSIQIKWTIANQISTDVFDVERSEMVTDNFKKVGSVNSTVSNSNYRFDDRNVLHNLRYYYRVKQISSDGTYHYSEIKTVTLNAKVEIRILPNPSEGMLNVFIGNQVPVGKVIMRVIDGKGSVVLKKSVFLDNSLKTTLNISGLVTGQYFLVISDTNNKLCNIPFQKK